MFLKTIVVIYFIVSVGIASAAETFVSNIQKELQLLGYDVGPIDGVAGRKTVSALDKFYMSHGIERSGSMDPGNLDFILKMKSFLGDQQSIKAESSYKSTDDLDIFSSPKDLCQSLRSIGLDTSSWKPSSSSPGEWICLSQYFRFGDVGSLGLDNNIAFYVYGDNVNRAKEVVVSLNVNNKSQSRQALDKLNYVITHLSNKIEFDITELIKEPLSSGDSSVTVTSFGELRVDVESARVSSYSVRLLDRIYLNTQELVRSDSLSAYESCLSVISESIGYSKSFLDGDGIPINENKYDSYMVKGRGNDLFFCELHENNNYKIKAAINGNYPFKYIASGTY